MRVIASAFKKDLSLFENLSLHKRAINALGNMGIKPLEISSSFNGEEELSLLFPVPFPLLGNVEKTQELYENIKNLFFLNFSQKSILYIRENKEAFLLFPSGEREFLGKWKEVSKEVALREKSFSSFLGRFFITDNCSYLKEEINI